MPPTSAPSPYGARRTPCCAKRRGEMCSGPLSGSATSVPTRCAGGGRWHSTGASLWVYTQGNHGTKVGCWWFYGQPSFLANSSSTPEHLWRDPVGPSSTKHQSTIGSMPPGGAVDGSTIRPTRPATVLYRMSSRTSANTPCLTPMELDGASLDQSVRIEKRYVIVDSNLSQCESKFGKMTTWAAGLDFDDPTWHWSESSAKVRPDFVGKQSQIHFMSISAQQRHKQLIHIDFIASYGGETTLFPRVYSFIF